MDIGSCVAIEVGSCWSHHFDQVEETRLGPGEYSATGNRVANPHMKASFTNTFCGAKGRGAVCLNSNRGAEDPGIPKTIA